MSNGKWKMENDLLFLFDDSNQMRNLLNHSSHRARVGPFDNLIQLSQTQTENDVLLRLRKANRTAVILNANRCRSLFRLALCFRHHTSKAPQPVFPASARPRKDLSS